MSARIETPEVMGLRLGADVKEQPARGVFMSGAICGVRADREQIAAWCKQAAEKADREAAAHAAQGKHGGRILHCEGQASALRALIALLGGGT